MQVTSKGQVTIPQEIRNRLGLLPYTEVEFELAGDHAVIRKAPYRPGQRTRAQRLIEILRGSATESLDLSTDEIIRMTRGPSVEEEMRELRRKRRRR